MSTSSVALWAELLPPRSRLFRGLLLSVGLWLFFMFVTAYTSAVTLLDRVDASDVMRAAAGGAWSGRIAWEISYFLTVVVLLHIAVAGLTWVLACSCAAVSTTARKKFGRIVVGWFCVLAGAVLAYNALWFPRTLIGAYYHDAMAFRVGPVPLGQVAYFAAVALCVVFAAWGGSTLLRSAKPVVRRAMLGIAVVGLGAWMASVVGSAARFSTAVATPASRPHVILLGIDSLRLEQLSRFGGTGVTPNLDRFLEKADLIKDTTTPAARTFSSWIAILTGRNPTITDARFNLAERSSVRANPTIADVLRDSGYRTVYSTDEVRFANIDETYGFDQLVTPRIGASDFLVGTYNELPLSSVVINTRVAKWLFPFSYANRGVATMFQPGTYIERLEREVSFDRPTFFISHLTAAHWPYYTADVPYGVSTPQSAEDRPMYRIGLQTADRMFGELVELLERKGALQNALVIVLSDHGEALDLPSDSFFDQTFHVEGMRAPLKMIPVGHGQSVLSQSQYQVLLSFRTFGMNAAFGTSGRDFEFPATVEDIAPTILEHLGVREDPLSVTGMSLLPILIAGAAAPVGPERIRFTETDLSVLPAPGGGVDEVGTARQNSMFFEVDRETARLHIRPIYAPLATTFKERAAFTQNHLLAAVPAGPFAHQYLYIDFARNYGRILLERPSGDELPEADRLWDALHEHYEGELRTPVSMTMDDWARIATEWETYALTVPTRRSEDGPDTPKSTDDAAR